MRFRDLISMVALIAIAVGVTMHFTVGRPHGTQAVAASSTLVSSESADEQTVEQKEPTLPCHKESYTSSGTAMLTWWYCDGRGHYRKAYTFYNGALHDTFVP